MTNAGHRTSVRVGFAACCVALLGVGLANRWLRATWAASPAKTILLDPPLSAIPLRIGEWEGSDVPLDEGILRVAGADDHINRTYVEEGSKHAVGLYISYVTQPYKMAGHRPRTCYPAHGWALVQTEQASAARPNGTRLKYLIHEFTLPGPDPERVVVLNYYVLDGRHTTSFKDFNRLGWGRPNIARPAAYYVAQVQVASDCGLAQDCASAKRSITRFASVSAPYVDALLPDAAPADVQ